MTFEAYHEHVITDVSEGLKGGIAAAAKMLGALAINAADARCSKTVTVTVGTDGGFTAECNLTCGPGYAQVIAIIRSGTSGGEECCRGVLDIAGCNPCSASRKKSPSDLPVLTVSVGNMLHTSGIMTIKYRSPTGRKTATLGINHGGSYECVEGSSIKISAGPRQIITGIAGCDVAGSGTVTFTVNVALVARTCGW